MLSCSLKTGTTIDSSDGLAIPPEPPNAGWRPLPNCYPGKWLTSRHPTQGVNAIFTIFSEQAEMLGIGEWCG